MKTAKKSLNHPFVPFSTFIEYRKKLKELKSALHIKKASITEARKILNTYITTHKLSNDIIKMREE